MASSNSNATGAEQWRGKSVLVTGVCGTVGSELLRQLLATPVAEIVGLDNNESELFFLQVAHRDEPRARFYIGDVRDADTLLTRMRGVDVVLHAAALKHVVLCEQSPPDAISTNIRGVQNVIDAAIRNGVQRVLFTSSDKAVNPTSVMGTSKLMGERLMTAAHAHARDGGPLFASTRFGNVLGSRGSVIPVFARQIAAGGPVTLTDTAMTRFIMTLEQAVQLVMESAFLARGGEAFVTKMPVVRIQDLAEVMIEELAPRYGRSPKDVPVEIIGAKAGEKLYEELLNEEEVRRSVELDRYFVVLPAIRSVVRTVEYVYPDTRAEQVSRPYNSSLEPAMSRDHLREYLRAGRLLEEVPCA
jgi:FlaA1/EpsC-like NDP-sugar epimerase